MIMTKSVIRAVAILLGVTLAAPGWAQTILVDRTGSVADQTDLERQLIDLLVAQGHRLCSLRIVLFSEHVFSAPAKDVRLCPERRGTHPIFFKSFDDAVLRRSQRKLRGALQESFRAELPIAGCTSINDTCARAAMEKRPPVLVITDGREECPAIRQRLSFNGEGAGVIVILTRARGDKPHATEVFIQREKQIKVILPKAAVYPQFSMDAAIDHFLSLLGPSGAVPASTRR